MILSQSNVKWVAGLVLVVAAFLGSHQCSESVLSPGAAPAVVSAPASAEAPHAVVALPVVVVTEGDAEALFGADGGAAEELSLPASVLVPVVSSVPSVSPLEPSAPASN